ncbi:dynein regulatory complex subunit 2 [Pangasianodon hypophthalmus]|uniref:dynein regulatory complex subunit 2 n=1 Tax=Pangasianodon hypophthalmus TaxID=310915 RepID=UPI002306F527|nr:dynein regulatory complex subunit 2 [Pangasianodon hypophthalmus]XP_026782035.3 dynein regulatory complex subunit 2 [Pangasianodon hypophthalmus]XP_034154268.2 dynein regulatory complex subunit 2 [Pangasianodon hypophthalmus]
MAQTKGEMLTQLLKTHIMKSKFNLHKLNQQWRSNLRQTRASELREDFAILSQTLKRVVDFKDNVIKLLVCDLSEAEQQSELAHRAHLQCVDHLLEVQKSRLAALESHWSTSLKELSTEYNTERKQLLNLHQKESDYLKAENFALEQRYAELDSEARQDYQLAHDDIKNRYIGTKHVMESTLEELRQWYLRELQKYTNATDDRKKTALNLQCAIQKRNLKRRHMQKLQGTIKALRSHLSTNQRDNEASACGLRAECEEITQEVQQLRAKLCSAQAAERTQLANHTIYSDNTIKKLQDIIGEGETLLRLADVCRKLETEQEKVLPFYTSSLTAEELSQEKAHAMEAMSEEPVQTMMDYTDLEKFWQRYNKVLLERLCLEREKKVLGWENQQLRILLKQYLDGISVNDEILQQRNSLLMLSCPSLQASPASESQTHTSRTVIEASHVVQHTL